MPRGKTRKNAKAKQSAPEPTVPEPTPTHFMDHEIQSLERQMGEIRSVKEVKTKHLLEDLRLLRSSFTEEQLQKPVLDIFEQILPNLSIVNDKETSKCDVTWKDKAPMSMTMNYDHVHTSLLQSLSMVYPHCPSSVPHSTGRTSFVGAGNLHLKDFVLEELSEAQTLTMQEGLETPGVSSQRTSVGMTPKTVRLPKAGEMLLSVHGSPLGAYKDNNMEAIQETEES